MGMPVNDTSALMSAHISGAAVQFARQRSAAINVAAHSEQPDATYVAASATATKTGAAKTAIGMYIANRPGMWDWRITPSEYTPAVL